jgi:ribonuclease D
LLWEKLRAWRLEEARRQELPPYVIFHDSTLIEVARRRPILLTALAQIPGIGQSKLDRYGAAVVAIVSETLPDRSNSPPSEAQRRVDPNEAAAEATSTPEDAPL